MAMWIPQTPATSFQAPGSSTTPASARITMVEEGRPCLPRRESYRPRNLRVGKSEVKVYLSAAIVNAINTINCDLDKTACIQEKAQFAQNFVDNVKEDCQDNPIIIMFDAGATIYACPFWLGGHFPLTNTKHKVTSASSADTEVFGRRTIPLRVKYSPEGYFMATFLVCDVTAPTLSFSQLRQQGFGCTMGKNNTQAQRDDHLQSPKRDAYYWEFSAEQNVFRRAHKRPQRYLFVPSAKMFPKGFNLDDQAEKVGRPPDRCRGQDLTPCPSSTRLLHTIREKGAPRVQELLPYRMTQVDPSSDDANVESFDLSPESIDFQSNDHIDSRIGGRRMCFTVFLENLGYMAKEKGRHDAEPPLLQPPRPSGQAHKANHFPHLRSLSRRRCMRTTWSIFLIGDGLQPASGQRGRRVPTLPLPERLPAIQMGVAFMGTKRGQERDALHGVRHSDADGDGDHRALNESSVSALARAHASEMDRSPCGLRRRLRSRAKASSSAFIIRSSHK